MKLERMLEEVLRDADGFTRKNGLEFVVPEIVLLCALNFSGTIETLEMCGVNSEFVRSELCAYIAENLPPNSVYYKDGQELLHSVAYEEVLESASALAASADKQVVDFWQYLVALFRHPRIYASYILKKNGMSEMSLLEAISDFSNYENSEFEPSFIAREADALEKFAQNLTQLARDGRLDALVGREEELERTIEVLCRRTKNNPIHVGDAGVGKTAITEGLAQRIVSGEVPEFLKDFEIYSVETGSLVAGTRYRGDFEKRIKAVVSAIQKKEKAILFIDEIHTLVGAGSASGALDAANILKPALAKGNLRCIGSTTFEEYAKSFEKDRALSRRFQKIDILEPSREDCLKILRGISPKYAEFHSVRYSPESIAEALDLSVRLFTDRRLPDKAIDLLDEAGVFVRLHRRHTNSRRIPSVTVGDIRHVAARAARVPVESVTSRERDRLHDIERTLRSEILGQEDAVHSLAVAVKKARAGFRDMEKPEASFLFVGPTGVGKTELAKVLATALDEKLLRFDMSEYQEAYSVSRLIGSAPGYVGYENGGVLTEVVRKNPHSVLLFDEIEKAHEEIYNALLQVLDYGTLTDGHGRRADFRNCLIIFTSNAGARDMVKGAVGFGGSALTNGKFALKEAVDRTFSPEFRNRLDEVVFFSPLDYDTALGIARKAIERISMRLAAKKISLEADESVAQFIAHGGFSEEFGARNIMRFAEECLASPLVDEILFGGLSSGGKIFASASSGKIEWHKDDRR